MNQESHGGDRITVEIPPEMVGERLDRSLATLLPQYSRSQIQSWMKLGYVRLDHAPAQQRYLVRGGECAEIEVPDLSCGDWTAEDIPLAIVHEDEHVLVIDKPPGLVVHPGAGNHEGTLLNALLSHCPELVRLPRAGIVHRLDKDTSGLLVVAKTDAVRLDLARQLKERKVSRVYRALVQGRIVAGGRIDAPIGRHPRERTRMAVVASGRPAVTHYHVRARYRRHTELEVHLESGRTHQIRVHMAYLRHPIVGDPLYAGRPLAPADAPDLAASLSRFPRQALHAESLSFDHPVSGRVSYRARLPADLEALLAVLQHDRDEREVQGG